MLLKSLVRHAIVALVGAIAVTPMACRREVPSPSSVTTKAKAPIVIGAVLPLTGDAATFGANAQKGAELAVEEANRKDPQHPFVLRTEDSRGTADLAASAGRKLLSVDHARALIGDVTSAGTHALIPIVSQSEVPLISPSASDPALSGASPYFARVWPSDVYEADVIAAHAKSLSYRRIAAIYANTDYGVAMLKQFRDSVGDANMLVEVPTERQTVDYRVVIQRVASRKPDVLFVVMYPEDSRRLLQQLREANIRTPILATATLDDPSVAGAAAGFDVVFASPAQPGSDDKARREFLSAYKAKFKNDPGVLADTGYDSATLLINGLRQGQATPQTIMSYIKTLRDWDGASGKLTFDERGDVRKPYSLKTVRDGKFVWK